MLGDLKEANPKAHAFVVDRAPFSAGLCPRRAGKSYTAGLLALITGLAQPGSITIIISLDLKQLRRLYWEGGPSGLWAIARRYGIDLEPHNQMLRWRLPNGSIGYLMGAHDDEQLEVLRGLEADLYIIDECKSFVPDRLRKLLVEILGPQRNSRKGRISLIGTPGHIKSGPFYEATCPRARDVLDRPMSIPSGGKDPLGRTAVKDRLWSRHHWTLQDNAPMAHQWDEALLDKAKNGWSDDNPYWRREYLGEWTDAAEGLVYRYADERPLGRVTWTPEPTKDNPTGLPADGAPWRLIGGLDIGFNDKTALVVLAYSSRLRQLRHVYDFSRAHMIVDDVADMLGDVQVRFGPMEVIYADTGNLGKMVVESLIRRGFPLERAEKREKFDHIELVNSAFARGEVLIAPTGFTDDPEEFVLEHQLLTNAWDLSKGDFATLARTGRLREDGSIENDAADAFLYAYRGSLHQFGVRAVTDVPEYLSPEWVLRHEREQLARARAAFAAAKQGRLGQSMFTNAPIGVRDALTERNPWKLSRDAYKRSR